MNYKRIHDFLIERAKNRVHNSTIYQLHHVIPKHEDRFSTEVVSLTFKEHYIVHLLRWKFTQSKGNKFAYLLMKGIRCLDLQREFASLGGKKGGKKTKELNKGIFSSEYDRASQTIKNWEEGVYDHIDFYSHCKRIGKITRENKSGIFNPELQHLRSTWAKLGAQALAISGNRKGCATKEWQLNNPEKQKQNASYGGKKGGKKVGSMLWWNNGIKNCKSFTQPGVEWSRGMLMSPKKKEQVYSKLAGHNRKGNNE